MEHNVTISAAPVEEQACPQCRTIIPVYINYASWCDQCGWNLQPSLPYSNAPFGSIYSLIGNKSGQSLFDQLIREETIAPTLSASKLLAFVMSALVHAITVAFVILGVNLIARGWPSIMLLVLGLLCIGIAWVMIPNMGKLPDAMAPRETFPALYAMLDQVAEALGTTPVHGIVIDSRFNASFGEIGWRRKKILFLGLPLFAILDPQERLALLAHELAHGVNRDPARNLFIGSAVSSLSNWYNLRLFRSCRERHYIQEWSLATN